MFDYELSDWNLDGKQEDELYAMRDWLVRNTDMSYSKAEAIVYHEMLVGDATAEFLKQKYKPV